MKINHTILSLTIVVLTSMLIIALGEHTYLAKAQIHIKRALLPVKEIYVILLYA